VKKLPSQKYLLECFIYDPVVGRVFWKRRPKKHFVSLRERSRWNTRHGGGEAFTSADYKGYKRSCLDGVVVFANKVIWKLVTGKDAPEIVDHKDRNNSNNCWCNLRLATTCQNAMNHKKLISNTSGVTGVVFHKRTGKWHAMINANKERIFLGAFDSKEEAIFARKAAEPIHHKEFRVQ
jgi:hypothetical protein